MNHPTKLARDEKPVISTLWNPTTQVITCKHKSSQGGKGPEADHYQVTTTFDMSAISEAEAYELAGEQLKVKWRTTVGFSKLGSLEGTDNQVIDVRAMMDNAKQRRSDPVKQSKQHMEKLDQTQLHDMIELMQARLLAAQKES